MSRIPEFLLGQHQIYRAFRRMTGSDRLNREFVNRYVRPQAGQKILDVGCGPADVLDLMPQVRYTGIDPSPDYVAAARHRFEGKGTFQCGGIESLESQRGAFDTVLCMGVMHHLCDAEVKELLGGVEWLLKPGGRLVSYDPCFTEPQHPFARWIHRHDRGEFVRSDTHHEQLVSTVFPCYRRHIRTDLCTVPSTVIIFDCEGQSPPHTDPRG